LWPAALIAALIAIVYTAVSMDRVSSVPTVPELEGRVLADARDRLDPLGVQVRTEFEYSSAPEGLVLEQAPAAGAGIRAGETVVLTVSKGPEPSLLERLGDGVTDAFEGIGGGVLRGLDNLDDLIDQVG
jgi:beta-lactam-binding protein with PASTA domain